MSDRLFQTEEELKKALEKDEHDYSQMVREGRDIGGIRQVIENKKNMLKYGTWR